MWFSDVPLVRARPGHSLVAALAAFGRMSRLRAGADTKKPPGGKPGGKNFFQGQLSQVFIRRIGNSILQDVWIS
jgi:hypothetical protein